MRRSLAFREKLLQWHDEENDREMPWKSEQDPYKIWLSEIILQQTRVEQGRSYYLKFIDKFPTVHDLAEAKQDTVLQMWEGLGYYSRARNLHETAKHISVTLGGDFPSTYNDLLALKGVGPYTASAIGSFAFGLPTPVVDGNSLRLVMRFEGNETPINGSQGKKQVLEFLSKAIPKERTGGFNQALMDFGATVCKPKSPLCKDCPLQFKCKAYANNQVHNLPVKHKAKPKTHRYFHFYIVHENGKLLLEKRRAEDIWKGLFQFPMLETKNGHPPEISELSKLLNVNANSISLEFLSHQTQTLSHRYIHAYFYNCKMKNGRTEKADEMWVAEPKLSDYGFPKVVRAFINKKQGTLL